MLVLPNCINDKELESRIIIQQDDGDERNPYLRDRDRIIFSRTFRRLSYKTQVVPSSGRITSDHIRSRLTHSLEVMQIASSIASKLNRELKEEAKNAGKKEVETLNIDLIQAIALGHDLGHTAYGHIGEEVLFKFIFDSNGKDKAKNFRKKKIRHSFQSLKVCCFLDKQFRPDFYGLNLTIATLDGIMKHSSLTQPEERKFYKGVFESYQKVFLENIPFDIDIEKKEKLIKVLFQYISPITYEGIIVSIADDIAQLCHDIEDMRRLGGFEEIKSFYRRTRDEISKVKDHLPRRILFDEFDNTLNDVFKNFEKYIHKLERLYIKIILGIYIPFVSSMIKKLSNMECKSREKLIKVKDFTQIATFKELELKSDEIELIKVYVTIRKEYNETLIHLPAVAKWDMKGKDISTDLCDKIYEAFSHKEKDSDHSDDINLNIIDYNKRDDIRKSYNAGRDFDKSSTEKLDGIPYKFAVWDYLAGMTDNFIIKNYEELTFKRADLK